MSDEYKAYLLIKKISDGSVIKRVGLSSISERYMDRVMSGILINMDTDRYYIDDSEVEAARKREQQA